MMENPEKYVIKVKGDEIMKKVIKMAEELFMQQEGVFVDINPMENLFAEKRLESFSMVQLILEVERKFNIEFSDNELSLEVLSTPKSIADKISNKLNQVCGGQNV